MLQLGETLGKFWEDDKCILWAVRKEMNIYDPMSRLWWNRLLLPILSLPPCIWIMHPHALLSGFTVPTVRVGGVHFFTNTKIGCVTLVNEF